MANDPGIGDPGNKFFLLSAKGRQQWNAFLENAEKTRIKIYQEESDKYNNEIADAVSLKSDSENYTIKLRALAENRPSIWKELKRMELDAQAEEEYAKVREEAAATEVRHRFGIYFILL